MTREQKLALIVGFSLILLVGVLISDHLSRARAVRVAGVDGEDRAVAAGAPNLPDVVPVAEGDVPVERAPVVAAAMPGPEPSPEPEVIALGPGTAQQLASGGSMAEGTRELIEAFRQRGAEFIQNGSVTDLRLTPMVTVDRPQEPVSTRADAPKEPATTWYTVQEGETLFQICKRLYGNGNAWRQIAKLNEGSITPDGGVRAGARIRVFERLPGDSAAPPKPEAKPGRPGSGEQRIAEAPARRDSKPADKPADKPAAAGTYTVQKGDSLGVISQRLLGTVKRKGEILALNRGVVEDEDSIRVGMVLKMPAR